jgi:hypothetical protein
MANKRNKIEKENQKEKKNSNPLLACWRSTPKGKKNSNLS